MKREGKAALPFLFIPYLLVMKYKSFPLYFFIFLIGILSCKKDTSTNRNVEIIQLISVKIGTSTLNVNSTIKNVPYDQPIQFAFTSAVDTNSISKIITIQNSTATAIPYFYSQSDNSTALTLTPASILQYSTDYILAISSALRGINGETFPGIQYKFTTLTGSMRIDSISLNGKAMTTSTLQNIDPKKSTLG